MVLTQCNHRVEAVVSPKGEVLVPRRGESADWQLLAYTGASGPRSPMDSRHVYNRYAILAKAWTLNIDVMSF
ncbi:hypothetical protein BB170200_02152 [Mycobacterium marinum]|nr:hypothetical protein BB170200_02152 [Mycobacterium marinum]